MREIAIESIKEYMENEFDYKTQQDIEDDLKDKEIGLAVGYYDTQASYDVDEQVLIFDCGEIVRYKPVKHEDIHNYLDYGYLVAELDDICELLGYEV